MNQTKKVLALVRNTLKTCLLAVCADLVFIMPLAAMADTAAVREHLSLDQNWKFHLGDDWPDALRLDKAGASGGPAAEEFDADSWRTVTLPHDWAVELPFDQNSDGNHGFKPVGPGFEKTSIGWYRRTFALSPADSGKRIWLIFDGVYRNTTVWVNGWIVKQHDGGYYPFREDITDVVRFGGTNTLAVRVDATKFEGWFYEGAGIYRHVWLDKTAPLAIAPDGIFVRSEFENNTPQGQAAIKVDVRLLNSQTNAADANIQCEIFSPNGQSLSHFEESANVEGDSKRTVKLASNVASPVLWSPESPELYKLVTTVEVAGNLADRVETAFGIRTVGFDPTNGFLLNGQHYELKGTCNHQDMAGVGVALPDALQSFRVAKLKEFGCNAIRTSHNPPTPELLDACDRLGMLIMDESRLLGSDSGNLAKWEEQIRRDRNHPSVAIWSIANEEFSVQDTPQAANVAVSIQVLAKHLDPTRPLTYAAPEGDTFDGVNGVIEVRGWNYHPGPDMDQYHAEHPDQPNVGTEQASTVSTRGIYANNAERGYMSAYDENAPPWAQTAETWWSFFADRPWLSGGFVWTGFDYRGEPTPYSWPCINSHFGVLDVCGFPKDNFYYYQSWWTTNTVLHLLPHWNWLGKEGQTIRVDALSNCREVELFLNGTSLGRKEMKPNSKLSWQVIYAPGTLSAKGYDAAGNVIAETKVETTGQAASIQLAANRPAIQADGDDVSVVTVSAIDAQGRMVPVADNQIQFALDGPGKIIGVGNGDPSSHEPDVYIDQPSLKYIAIDKWRYQLIPGGADHPPVDAEYAPDFDDSSWNLIRPKTDGDTGDMFLKPGESAVYRAHVLLTKDDLDSPVVQIRFPRIDDNGWVFVNNRAVGESHDWKSQPVFVVKQALHEGDNVIAVRVKNDGGQGGLNPGVNMEIALEKTATPWSRHLFNGLAEVIIQSTRDAGEIKLTATAPDLQTATATVETTPATPQPEQP